MERRVEIKKDNDRYYIIDTKLQISYPLDNNKCLIKQINDICEIINMKGDNYDKRNKNREEP